MNYKKEIIRNCKYGVCINDEFIEKYLKLPKDFFDIPEITIDDLIKTEITRKTYNHYFLNRNNNEITVTLIGFNSNYNDIAILLFPTIKIEYNNPVYSIIVYGYICDKNDIRKLKTSEDIDTNDIYFYNKKLSSVKFLNNYKDIEDKLHSYYNTNDTSISDTMYRYSNNSILYYNKGINFPNNVLNNKDTDIGEYIISYLNKTILNHNGHLIDKLNLKKRITDYKNEEINKRSEEIDKKFFNIICNHKDFNFNINVNDIYSYYEEDLISWNSRIKHKLEKGYSIIGEKIC